MVDNFDNLVDTLVELKINANQFLLCSLLLTDKKQNGKFSKNKTALANVYKYAYFIKWNKSDIEDLVEKGYLKSYNSSNVFDADLMEVTPKLEKAIFASKSRFQQLLDLYPKTLPNFNGTGMWKTTACDIDALEEVYNKIVKTQATHDKIMKLTRWAVENNQLSTNLDNYVRGRCWMALEDIQEKYTTQDNMNIAK